jgi:hypothetical protein
MKNCTNQTKVFLNNKFAATINTKRKESLRICYAIKEYFKELTGLELPRYHKEFWAKKAEYFQHDYYGLDLEFSCGDLIRMYYGLLYCNIKSEASFRSGNQEKKQLLACKYSKHRLDPIWNFRKSRLIRKIYTEYLETTQLHKSYHPVHLVLTVPHTGGLWKGKRFYSNEIIAAFNKLRKTEIWKTYIYAGEYGVEIKPSKKHGLHIHIHSLVFQNPQYTVDEVREAIAVEWKDITDNHTDRSGIHYETLYYHKKAEGSREFEVHPKWVNNEGNWEQILVRKKFYITKESTSEEMMLGIMECIKYHFKHDIFSVEDLKHYNGIDVTFLSEVCKETKHKRLYSRFGAFYKVKELNFNNLNDAGSEDEKEETTADLSYFDEPEIKEIEEPQDLAEMEKAYLLIDQELEREQTEYERHQWGKVCDKEERLINPFTFEPAKKSEYYITLSLQNTGLYKTKRENYDNYKAENDLKFYVRDDIDFTSAWRLVMQGKITEVLDDESLAIYERDYMFATVEEQLSM